MLRVSTDDQVMDEALKFDVCVLQSGALVRLTCLVRQSERENFVLHWKFGEAILNHDTQRGGVR